MKYFEVEFTISPYSADAADLFASLAGEAGFETFEETETGLKGYVQQSLFDEDALRECIEDFPFEGTSIIYNVREAEDRDWNEQWEQEGFEPIVIADQLVIHDGRHLPEVDSKVQIEIDAKLAFGTGTHETTRMICTQLLKLAKGHNAVINRVDDRFTSLLGDAKILENIDEKFDIVLANINRNILLADMPMFVSKMHEGSLLILSGFYSDDCEILIEKAHSIGLKLVSKTTDHDWACLVLKH